MELAPIALFTYNRLKHTRATIDALKANIKAVDSDLYIFSDGPKNPESRLQIEELRDYLAGITGFKKVTVIARDTNWGLARNIIEGVTELVNKYGKIIVLEDDLITAPYFIQFMNTGLTMYENEPEVISIVGYTYPGKIHLPETFFIKGADCWGWATWKRGWDLFEPDGRKLLTELTATGQTYEFDFNGAYPFTQMLQDQLEGKNNSWAIRWYASAFLHNKYTLYPGKSLVANIGADGSGTHMGIDDGVKAKLSNSPIIVEKIPVKQSPNDFNAIRAFHYKLHHPSFLYRVRRYFKKQKRRFTW